METCNGLHRDLGLELQAPTADTAAEAVAAQAIAAAAQIASTQVALEAKAAASAAAAPVAQNDFAAAQAALDAADEMILVAGMQDVMEAVFGGFINPGEILDAEVVGSDAATDIAVN